MQIHLVNYFLGNMMNTATALIKQEKLKIIDWLIEQFPTAFFRHPKQIKPLKVGIFDDIIEFYDRLDSPAYSKKALRDGLNYYSRSPAYLQAQIQREPRIDLYGNAVDVVTEEQATYAKQRFEQRYKRILNN